MNTLNDLLQLTLITPLGEEIDLNDLAMYVAERSDGFGMPPFHRLSERGPQQHGASDLGFRLDPRTFTFTITARAGTPAEHYQRRDQLLRSFAPSEQPCTLRVTLPDGGIRDIRCFLEKGLSFGAPQRRGLAQSAELALVAPDPTFYNPVEKGLALALQGLDGLVFPITFPLTLGSGSLNSSLALVYAGSWEAYPQIYLTGPLVNPEIDNQSTNEAIRLSYSISVGEQVIIDTRYGHKTVSNNRGQNLMHAVTSDSSLATWRIDAQQPGGLNLLRITGSGAAYGETEVRLAWQDRYLGI